MARSPTDYPIAINRASLLVAIALSSAACAQDPTISGTVRQGGQLVDASVSVGSSTVKAVGGHFELTVETSGVYLVDTVVRRDNDGFEFNVATVSIAAETDVDVDVPPPLQISSPTVGELQWSAVGFVALEDSEIMVRYSATDEPPSDTWFEIATLAAGTTAFHDANQTARSAGWYAVTVRGEANGVVSNRIAKP